jgi:hypothetical protein
VFREGAADGWHSTPLNYLEKIFQIPFALRPMERDGFRRLVDNLTEQQVVAKRVNTGERNTGQVTGAASGEEEPGEPSVPGAAEAAAALPAIQVNVFDPNPEPLQLRECERKFMWQFQSLIPSPRAAKRFVNVYRLLRAAVNARDLDRFVREDGGGEYEVVQLLLAIQTGYPEQAMHLMGNLAGRSPEESWGDYLKTQNEGEFLDRVKRLNPEVFARRPCEEFVRWAPRVARYSFQAAHSAV